MGINIRFLVGLFLVLKIENLIYVLEELVDVEYFCLYKLFDFEVYF